MGYAEKRKITEVKD